jgi:aldehyde:ferredoxin oxidoreductase
MEQFPEYMYSLPSVGNPSATVGQPQPYYMPTKINGVWDFRNVAGRHLDREKVEQWKTKFYKLEGWDTKTGWQTRALLESLGMQKMIDALARQGKIDLSGKPYQNIN